MPLERKKKTVLILCPYPENITPGQRLKYEQYFEIWRKNGYELTVYPFVSDDFMKIIYTKGNYFRKIYYTICGYLHRTKILPIIPKFDIVYVTLWITPLGFPVFEWVVRKLAKKLVYDIDDLVYLNQRSQANPYIDLIKGKGKPIYLMKSADHVITCTPYLNEFVQKFNPNTTDISSTVDTEHRYKPINNYQNNHPLVIGWSGSHSTVKHLLTITPILKKIQKKYPNIKYVFCGAKEIKIEGLNFECVEWREETEIPTLQSFDIGIYPLPNEEWVFGKSGLKAIQYMALGIPTVATAIGTNFRVIEDNISGFLVSNEEEWVEKISLLLDSPDLRRKIGEAGRKKVERFFSLKANAPTYLGILDSLTAKPL